MANNDIDGVWRTIGGRRVFIKNGQSLSEAMIQSGKFKNLRSDYKKAKEEEKKLEEDINPMEEFSDTKGDGLSDAQRRQLEREQEIKAKQEEVNKSFEENQKKLLEVNKPEGQKTADLIKENNIKTFGDEIEEKERLDIAKDIAKEVYGLNENNASPERIEKEARRILEYNDGETLEKGDEPYKNSKGELERSTKSLKEWRNSLKGNAEENKDTFVSQSTNPFYPDREYSKEDLKKMEENGVKPMDNTYSGSGWKGVNADKNLSTKEQAKAITDEMKKQYPDVKISRKSDIYSGGSSIDFNIMSSEKDLYVSDADIDKLGSEQLFNTDITRGYGFDRWAENNVPNYKTEHSYSVDDVKKYAKESLSELKKRDNQNVRGDEWYLSDYGKKVVSELNKQANSYTYDDSDAMTDYFNHGTYMSISIGKWDKPYEVKSSSNGMNDVLRNSAYKKYMKEHPNSKMTLQEFKKK